MSTAPSGPYGTSPEEIVACVGSDAISGTTFAHWAAVAQRAAGSGHHQHSTGLTRAVVMETMGFLISTDWVLGEAADLHVVVSDAEVRHRFDRLRREQFHRRSAFRAFLRSTGETVDDLLLRVRLSVLSTRIQQRIVGHGHHPRLQQRRLSRFVRRFQRKWRAQTYCESRFAVSDCGHAVSTL